ncbi:hypothetical protein [Bdellovibrio reynosensis]|uniref:C2 domain-containing protein n=1 Tax=Bdellovibrio reynosensis TaxID=2835041 RepID=A0ABY4C8Z6_9BACT|nr:hypothetical protein [Bdellovibrio reynosensis]UOF00151.1 hypothetical protein MNR06_10600 [Bdellovibrio reynosensis]
MLIEWIFSFMITTWQHLPEVETWANENLGGVESLTAEILREEEILCVLEKHALLSFDSQWTKRDRLKIPAACRRTSNMSEYLEGVQFRTEPLLKKNEFPAWDHRLDVVVKNQTPFTIYLRRDRDYLGAHSTAGWSMWIELKTGILRFEWVDQFRNSHLRMKAHTELNPLKGNLKLITHIDALMVTNKGSKVGRAALLTGRSSEGFKHIVFERLNKDLLKSKEKCTKHHSCKKVSSIAIDELKLQKFANVKSSLYTNFLKQGRPLSFSEISPEELVPQMAVFR